MATASTNLPKSKAGYGYKYTELAQINEYLETIKTTYYQFIETNEAGIDYIYTVPIVDGKELPARRGCRVVDVSLQGKSNAAQQQGAAITYARRYSLLMAFGLATEDDDAESLSVKRDNAQEAGKAKAELLKEMQKQKVSTEAVCKVYNVKSIDDLSAQAMQNAIKNMDKINQKAEEMK